MCTVGYGDITPQTLYETAFTILIIFSSGLMYKKIVFFKKRMTIYIN